MRKILSLVAISLISVLLAATACTGGGNITIPSKEHSLSFLKTEGKKIVNAEGEEVVLRGVNAGGLGVIEQWMTGFAHSSAEDSPYVCRDFYTTSKVFLDRFGLQETETIWSAYQTYWWTDEDFEHCRDMGMNVIRLPFTYMNVDFDALVSEDKVGDYDFTFLDEFVDRAESFGLYTILDLHGAYGSQNGQDHSGQTIDSVQDVTFYSNETMLSRTADMWGAIAAHFKDHPAVAGYDLLNEPGEKAGTTSEPHFRAMDRFYRAIRAAGDEHIVIFESCWAGSNLPMPEEYGWENCVYEFHHYTGCAGTGREEEHKKSFEDRITEVESRNFGVPLYMGEFTCYTSREQWEYTLMLLNRNGWHWTTWTYKIWGSSGWGIYNIITEGQEKINAHTDELDTIYSKLRRIQTGVYTRQYIFAEGVTLFDVLAAYTDKGGAQ